MDSNTRIGMNKTGVQMSPMDVNRMLNDVKGSLANVEDGAAIAAVRTTYITEADPVGTVPVPGSMKGMVKTGMQKIMGKSPEVLVDKLGERLAFERSGTRLYDALITKCRAMPTLPPDVSIDQLMHFRDEEARHFKLVAEAMESLGADPTAQTPCADIGGVESMGIMQVLDDPRTTLPQCLHAILVAEMADNAGWELLIALAEEAGQDQMAASFGEALASEQEHLHAIKELHAQCVRAEFS
jgi:rubrerythrin